MTGKTRMLLVAAAAILIVGAVVGVRLLRGGDAETIAPIRVAEADLPRGERLYAENCAACHGADLEGEANWRTPGPDGVMPAPPHDETGHTWHHADGLLIRYTMLGGEALMAERGVTNFRSGMPGFGDTLTDTDIRDVLAYIKSRWPEKARKRQAAITEAANTPR